MFRTVCVKVVLFFLVVGVYFFLKARSSVPIQRKPVIVSLHNNNNVNSSSSSSNYNNDKETPAKSVEGSSYLMR